LVEANRITRTINRTMMTTPTVTPMIIDSSF
jgi:hypothetical protein